MPEALLIAGRYRVVRSLGRGGNAQVFEVHDEAKDVRVALKSLTVADAARQQSRDLFQREFNTLSQLAHPLIVRVFDYGVDETPFYTMELIAGQSLRAQFPWREACSLLRDVASALSLVHSRRLVHRDVTHRNVYRTEEGRAKLFDFGALAPMGPTMDVVGTPAFMPPEAVTEQRLDARSDLYSLGALGYFLLTERHAFPARRVADLGDAWRHPVGVPSSYAPDVPRALDDLIVSLLSLSAVARPTSAAEVFDRLTAIAGLPAADAPEVAQAYLTTPALVGRSDALRLFRQLLARTHQNKSAPLVIEGAQGLGRSRLLANVLLEAKLDGCLVLRTDAFASGAFGAVRALAKRFFAAEPLVARDAAGSRADLLAPLLFDAGEPVTGRDDGSAVAIVEALCSMFAAAAEQKTVVIGVDDFERLDASSKQVVVRLAGVARRSRLALVVALAQDTVTEAHTLLRAVSSRVALAPLSPTETGQLVCSLFGDVANVDTVSRWVHGLSGGRPRTALEAANHLVDTGVARFEEGLWVLPRRMEDLELPASIDQALDARIALLGDDARRLCQALSLSSEQDPLFSSEYAELVEGLTGARLDAALNELVARSVVVPLSSSLVLAHAGMREAARRSISERELADVHRRLARAYASGPTPSLGLSAYHALQANDVDAAFTHALRWVRRRKSISVRGSAFMRTPEGTRSFERLFAWGLEVKKPWPEVVAIGQLLLQQAAVADMELVRHRDTVISRLRLDSGLDDWAELSELKDPLERIQTAIARAFARHESTPENERGLSPLEALESLCGACAGLTGVFARRSEPLEVAKLLPLLEPFRPLSPAVGAVADMVSYSVDSLLSRDVREVRLRSLELLSSPIPGLDDVPRMGMHWLNLYYLALDDAPNGRARSLERLGPLMQTATYAPLAWEVRLVEALWQGDMEGADAARRERDLSNFAQSADICAQLEGGMVYEALAYDLLGDLLRLKQLIPLLEERARRCRSFESHHQWYLGCYHRLRGEPAKALATYQRALALAPSASRFGEWPYIVWRLGEVLLDSGRAQEARDFSRDALAEAVAHGTTPVLRCLMEMTLAMAEAAVGSPTEATERSERVIREATERGIAGIVFVNLCRSQGRIAELIDDEILLERAIVRLEDFAARTKYPAFATKHAHLLRYAQGRGRFQAAPNQPKALGGMESTHTSLVVGLRTQIELCTGRDERAKRALKILLDAASSDEGFLYLCDAERLELAASSADANPPAFLEAALSERILAGAAEGATTDDGHSEKRPSARPMSPTNQFDVVEVITQSNGRCILAALAAMKPRNGRLSPVPMLIREALSDALITAGDTAGIPWV
jgi:tetratricopeptide (TPR) repeat protein